MSNNKQTLSKSAEQALNKAIGYITVINREILPVNITQDIIEATVKDDPNFERATGLNQKVLKHLFGSRAKFYKALRDCCTSVGRAQTESGPESREGKTTGVASMKELHYGKGYVYNYLQDSYVFLLKGISDIGRDITLPGNMVRGLVRNYTHSQSRTRRASTVNELCRDFLLTRAVVKNVLRVLHVTHDSAPFTREEAETRDHDDLAREASIEHQVDILNHIQRREEQALQADAMNWQVFRTCVIDPIREVVENWNPPELMKLRRNIIAKVPVRRDVHPDRALVIGYNDIHFGNFAHAHEVQAGMSWSINDSVEMVQRYAELIREEMNERTYEPAEVVVVSLGDILHSLSGFTMKGTKIEAHPIGSEQFRVAMDTTYAFLAKVRAMFPNSNMRVYSVDGNHDPVGDNALFTALEKALNYEMDFEVSSRRWLPFTIFDSLFVAEHGYSPYYKSKVPSNSTQRESYVQRVLLDLRNQPELLANKVQNYFLVGDQHSFTMDECAHFEFVRFGSIDGVSKYADNNNLRSLPRQNGLLVKRGQGATPLNFIMPLEKQG